MQENPRSHNKSIPTNKVKTHEEPGRADRTDDTLDSMILSIQQIGLLHPITVISEGDDFRCLAGSRRLAACRALDWEQIPAVIIHNPSQNEQVAISALENLERKDLDHWQEATMCQDALKLTPDINDLAKLIHRSTNWIQSRLSLLTWPQEALDCLHSGVLSMSALAPLAGIPEAGARAFYLEQATVSGANTRTTTAWASGWKADFKDRTAGPEFSAQAPTPPATPTEPPTGICLSCGQKHNLNALSHMPICPPCLGAISEAQRTADAQAHSNAAAAAASDTDG